MSNATFELNLAGLDELMKSPEMVAILEDATSQVANSAGKGFGKRVGQGSYAAIGNVFAESKEAAKKAYDTNCLLQALFSARV